MSNPYIEGSEADAFDFGYEQGRADAIDEFAEEIEYSFKLNGRIGIEDIERLVEQLRRNYE